MGRGLRSLTHSRRYGALALQGVNSSPCAEKRAKARSQLTPMCGKACGGEESPDFAGLLHQLFTPLHSGVQLGCIA